MQSSPQRSACERTRFPGEALDPVLEPFLNAPQRSAAEHDSLRILIDGVTPVIDGVLRGRAGAAVAPSEREELSSEVILQLIRRLQDLKSDPAPNPITNLNAYAAVTAFHVIHAHFRRAHPELHRLRNRIRHVVRTSTPFALWRLPSGQSVCGRAAWVGTASAECPQADLDRIPPLAPPLSKTWSDSMERPRITRALDHIFSHVRKPIELEQLVETIADLFQLPVTPPQAGRSERIDQTASIESSLVIRSALVEVWREVDLLPPRQRIALLLGLRDENGSSVTSLLIHLRIVTFAELAVAVDLSSDALSAIWDHLPLSDLAIAERLDLSRQQVINLRKSARERLGRRFPFCATGNPLEHKRHAVL